VTWNPFFGSKRKTSELPTVTPLEHSLYMVTAPTPITPERAADAAAYAASRKLSLEERSKARCEARRAGSVQLLRSFCEVGLNNEAPPHA
jgi:hypothetical protein